MSSPKEMKMKKKKKKEKEKSKGPWAPSHRRNDPGCLNMISFKGSNPEMNVSDRLNHSYKAHGIGGISPSPPEIKHQFLWFGEMVKLTRMGKLTNLRQWCAQRSPSGRWNTWLLWEKYPVPDPDPGREAQGGRASQVSQHQ